MIADPDSTRRARIVSGAAEPTPIEAASLSEAFDLAEAHHPNAIAVAAEITAEPGFDMFLQLVDALSIAFVAYGDRARIAVPERFRKAIRYVPFGPCDQVEKILDGFLASPEPVAPSPLGNPSVDALAVSAQPSPSVIVLGASTGGVSALESVLGAFPANCPPTLVVQHIRAGFIEGMIRRLDGRCLPRVLPAEDAVRIKTGHVYVAHDPERHLVVQSGEVMRCRLKSGPARHGHRPSVDALFASVAGRRNVSAALLTGMGADGAEGMRRIRQGGGFTIAQNEATCVVYGMPRVAVERGAADLVLPLEKIAAALICRPQPASHRDSQSREMAK